MVQARIKNKRLKIFLTLLLDCSLIRQLKKTNLLKKDKAMKDLISIYKALGLNSTVRPILQYAKVTDDRIQMTNLETTYEIENMIIQLIGNDETVMIHLPTLEKCHKLGFKKMTFTDQKLIDIETGISVDMPKGKLKDYPKDIPVFSDYDITGFIKNEISSEDILKVGQAVAAERSRFAINGLAVYPNGSLAATDGRRLHIKGKVSKDNPVILPQSVIKLAKILQFDAHDAIIETNPESQYAIISGDLGVIGFKLIQGKYPEIHNIIPKKKQDLKMEAAKLLPILKKIKKVHGKNDPNGVVFKKQISWNGINFPFKLPEGINHIFDFTYLIEALEVTKSKYFTVPEDNQIPIKIENDCMIAIITPINIV